MSFDLAIWKRSPTTKTAMIVQVYEAICEDQPHPATGAFDVAEFESALISEFGNYKKEPDAFDCLIHSGGSACDGSNCWIIVCCAHPMAAEVESRLIPLALQRELMVYNPQRQSIFGNKRPPKSSP
jgi:hypothetical protein